MTEREEAIAEEHRKPTDPTVDIPTVRAALADHDADEREAFERVAALVVFYEHSLRPLVERVDKADSEFSRMQNLFDNESNLRRDAAIRAEKYREIIREWMQFSRDVVASDCAGTEWLEGLSLRSEAALSEVVK